MVFFLTLLLLAFIVAEGQGQRGRYIAMEIYLLLLAVCIKL